MCPMLHLQQSNSLLKDVTHFHLNLLAFDRELFVEPDSLACNMEEIYYFSYIILSRP